jgi:hypothetical protein
VSGLDKENYSDGDLRNSEEQNHENYEVGGCVALSGRDNSRVMTRKVQVGIRSSSIVMTIQSLLCLVHSFFRNVKPLSTLGALEYTLVSDYVNIPAATA